MKDPSSPPQPPPQPPYATVAPPLPCPEQEKLRCPRCDSLNTKFCYYNNYNLLQPRHFCKACRRYWTKGGSLRNIPVGGASRKTSKRPSSSKRTPSGGSQMPEPMSACMGSGMPPPMDGFASSSGGGGGGGDEFMKGCWSGGESNVEWGDIANFTPTSTFQ